MSYWKVDNEGYPSLRSWWN